ncbi:RDD family protein [Planomonospora corallina]|uniref:RDD family protein n=1 Tax=Planomonospora corallina TaxID=1806052 RepID=A0ABV8I216_9ACTN
MGTAVPPPALPARPAEWWERLAARAIDGIGFVVLYWIVSLSLYPLFASGSGDRTADPRVLPGLVAALVAFGAYTVYDYVMHARYGRTFGKKLLRIRLTPYGGAVLDRTGLMRRAALFPGVLLTAGIPVVNLGAALFGSVAALFILIDKPFQRGLHDRAAGSMVVRDLC